MALGDFGVDSELKPASELKVIAESAFDRFIRGSIARACNGAASTGGLCVEWVGELPQALKTELEGGSFGYKFKQKRNAEGELIDNVWIISWE